MNQAIAPWFAAAQAWVDRFYHYVFDHSGQRGRLLEREGFLKAETTDQWGDAYGELIDLGRALLLDLDNLVIPRLPGDLEPAFARVRGLLADLHFAIHNVGSETDGGDPGGTSPYEDDLLPAETHRSRVLSAVGPCREIVRDLNECLDQCASGSSDAEQAAPSSTRPGNPEEEAHAQPNQQELRSLHRTGKKTWRLRFGGRDASIRHLDGLERFAALLAHPHTEIQAIELSQLGSGRRGGGEVGNAPPGVENQLSTTTGRAFHEEIDPKLRTNLKTIRNQIQELSDDRQRYLNLGREEMAARVDTKIENLESVINQYGLGGRERDDSAPAEKARRAVGNSLTYARQRIKEKIPEFAEYLEVTVHAAGTAFIFSPSSGEPAWRVETDYPRQ